MAKTVELRKERAGLFEKMRDILDKAEAREENPGLTTEERSEHDKMDAAADALEVRYLDIEKQEARESALEESTSQALEPGGGDRLDDARAKEDRALFVRFVRGGRQALSEAEQQRALQMDSDTAGGYLLGEQLSTTLIKKVDDLVFVRQLATIHKVTGAKSLGAPSLDNDPADSNWTSEIGTGSEDSTMDFGKRELIPKPLAKRLKVTKKLLRNATNVEALVLDRLAYKSGITEEKAFLTGNGVNKPLGVMVADASGISTGRDVSTGNTATSMTFDGLKEAKYLLKSGYLANAQWSFHRDGVKQIDKLKDGEGRYIWQASVVPGRPDTLLSFPIRQSEYMPNTFTTGLYVGILADWSNYWIADDLAITIQRLDELYSETNQVGFISRLETDGMPVLEEAFARVKLG